MDSQIDLVSRCASFCNRKPVRYEQGATIVEMSVALIVFLVVMMSAIELVALGFVSLSLQSAVIAGADQAAVGNSTLVQVRKAIRDRSVMPLADQAISICPITNVNCGPATSLNLSPGDRFIVRLTPPSVSFVGIYSVPFTVTAMSTREPLSRV